MRLIPVILVLICVSVIMPAHAEIGSCNELVHLKYNIESGKVVSCTPKAESRSLIITIESKSDGQITLEIPRSIGLSEICTDVEFFTLVDGAEVHSNQERTIFSRIVAIPFEDGNTQIEIIASWPAHPYSKITPCYTQPPMQQALSGIVPDEVICNLDFILLQKNSDGSVACVIPSTAQTLISRGWGSQIYEYDSAKVTTNNGVETVNYRIRNGIVNNIIADSQLRSIIVEMSANNDGKIIITIPRTVLDARLGPDGKSGEDDSFFVLVDGAEVDFKEKTDHFARELAIPFQANSNTIEIIGTNPPYN